MSSPEQWKEQRPQRREASFTEKAMWAGIGILFAVGSYAVYRFSIQPPPPDDDDRPPIIVRNGSVHHEEGLVVTPAGKTRGKLTKTPTENGNPPGPPAGRSIWYHDYKPGKPAKLDILVEGFDFNSGTNCATSQYFFAPDVTNATISYKYDASERTVVVSLGGNGSQYLELNVDDQAGTYQPTGKEYILALEPNEPTRKLTKVAMFWKGQGSNPGHTETCTFGETATPQVTILQRK